MSDEEKRFPTPASEATTPVSLGSYPSASEVDGRVLELFHDRTLRNRLAQRNRSKIDLDQLWNESRTRLASYQHRTKRLTSEPIETHTRVVRGLSGASLLIAAAMLWDNLDEAQKFYGITARALRSRLGNVLSIHEGELAMRAGRVTEAAAAVFGSHDFARRWLRTRNFALGGVAPRELLRTAEGEQVVLDELQSQAEGGPL